MAGRALGAGQACTCSPGRRFADGTPKSRARAGSPCRAHLIQGEAVGMRASFLMGDQPFLFQAQARARRVAALTPEWRDKPGYVRHGQGGVPAVSGGGRGAGGGGMASRPRRFRALSASHSVQYRSAAKRIQQPGRGRPPRPRAPRNRRKARRRYSIRCPLRPRMWTKAEEQGDDVVPARRLSEIPQRCQRSWLSRAGQAEHESGAVYY